MAEGIPTKPYVVVIGAAGIDSKGKANASFVPGSSVPGTVRVSVGGVARNVADNLSRLGVRAVLLSAIGTDGSGKRILNNATEVGIDTSYMMISTEYHTAAYLALLDEKGNLVMSVDDMEILTAITPPVINRWRSLIKNADLIFIDSNLSEDTITALVKVARRYKAPICADPTSTTLATRLMPHLRHIYMITPNVVEAEILSGKSIGNAQEAITAARVLVNAGVKLVVITLAEEGMVYATVSDSGHLPAVATEVIDSTGASDALTATIVFGLLNHMPTDEAVRLGASAAALTLACTDTVCPDLSLELLYDQLLI